MEPLHKDTACCFEQILEAAPQKAALQSLNFYHIKDEQDMLGTNSKATLSCGLLYTDTPLLTDQQKFILISSMCEHWMQSRAFDKSANCISHNTNTLGKGMNPIILPPAMGKL